MIAAYRCTEDGNQDLRELQLYGLIKEFGAQSVLGRPLYAREVYRINAARNVYLAKMAREKPDGNWVEWMRENPVPAKMLTQIEKMIQEESNE